MMRFSWMIAMVLAGVSVNGLAQQPKNSFKVKASHAPKAAKVSAPIGKTAGSPATASTTTSKDLQSVERQTAKATAPSRSGVKRAPASSALKPAKEKPNPPINFNGASGGKNAGVTNQNANPYKGRLRQKHAHQ